MTDDPLIVESGAVILLQRSRFVFAAKLIMLYFASTRLNAISHGLESDNWSYGHMMDEV